MDPPCQIVITKILPTFRFLVAKQLTSKHGFTQMQAANKMGITQSAISQYLASKRATRGKDLDINYSLVESMAKETAEKIARNQLNPAEIVTYFCKLCMTMRESNYCI